MTNKEQLRAKFEKKFNDMFSFVEGKLGLSERDNVWDWVQENFISKEVLQKNIGMMRQWLNEDRITDGDKLVTNADLEHWLINKK